MSLEGDKVYCAVGGEMCTVRDYSSGFKVKDDGSRVYTIECSVEVGGEIFNPKVGVDGGWSPVDPQVVTFALRFPGGSAGEQSRGISRKDIGKLVNDVITDTRADLARLMPDTPDSVLPRLIGAKCYVKSRAVPKKDGSEMIFFNVLVPEQLVAASLDDLADLLPDNI